MSVQPLIEIAYRYPTIAKFMRQNTPFSSENALHVKINDKLLESEYMQ